MRLQLCTTVLVIMAISVANAQVASHAPIVPGIQPSTKAAAQKGDDLDKPVARVNGAVLTERDVLREMFTIFPYARQHNGFPKDMEPQIRKGALDMIIFEELVYQEAKRRNITILPARLSRAQADFRKQFPNEAVYQQFLKLEVKGSKELMRERIRRSLMIEALLDREVRQKAKVSLPMAKAFYDNNPKQFEHGETFHIQTISIIPPQNASTEVQKEAKKRAEDALRQAKATKSYRDFGLLAEKISDDDWHVNMGDRKRMDATQLPPPIVTAARKMKPGQVSELLQFGPNYTLFRLDAYSPAGKEPFEAVKTKVRSELEKAKYEAVRAEFHQKLRKNAKIQVL